MSRRDDLQQLIINYGRRLQKLQEQQALMGLDTPPHTLIEIEDIQAKITELEEKLAVLTEADFVVAPPYSVPEQQVQPLSQSAPQPPTQRAIFVGRQTQLAELERHWQEAYQQQRGKVVFLVGEAGIGKTSLVREFSQAVLAKYPQVQYAEAQCDQIAGDISPYAPFVQLLNNLTEQATRRGKHWSVEFIREIGPDILGMVPVAGPILATAAKSADFAWRKSRREDTGFDRASQFGQQDIFQQFTDTFRNLAHHKSPLLLFIDDWHWADTSSTNLLFHLARQLSDVPILLLATYRPHDAQARKHPILTIRTEMERYQLCVGVSLDFLSRDDLIAYLNRRFPQTQFEPAFVDWLLDITNGNALFTSEYVNLLLSEKLLTPNGQLVGDLGQVLPPANVEAVIRSRLGFLDQEARDMLAYGSVEGEQFTTLVLSRLLDLKPLSLLKRLRTIEETHQLIASQGQQTLYDQQTTVYHFIHTLIHRTLYNSLEFEERTEINRLLLELRGQIYVQADEATKARLAPELMAHAAEASDYLAQAHYALAAARDAAQNYAHTEALKHCEVGIQALSRIAKATPDVEILRLQLLLRQAQTEAFNGAHQESLETYSKAEILARAISDYSRLYWAFYGLGKIRRNLGDFDQAYHYYNECVSLAEQLEDKFKQALAYYQMGQTYWHCDNYDQALIWSYKALTLAEEVGDKANMASSYQLMGIICHRQDNFEQALQWHQRALFINLELGNKVGLGWNYNNMGFAYEHLNDERQALELYHKSLSLWQEVGFRYGESIAMVNIGDIYRHRENYDQALEWYTQSLTINEKLGHKSGLAWNYSNIGLIYFQQGDSDKAMELYEKALGLRQEVGEKGGIASLYHKIGEVFEKRGEFDQALEWYQKALTIREQLGKRRRLAETRQRIAEVEAKLGK